VKRRTTMPSPGGAALVSIFTFSLVACSHLLEHSNAGISSLEADPGRLKVIAQGAKYSGWAVSAPLVAGMIPVAALAWATPWVDLPDAVDIASAPAIGLGYFFEAHRLPRSRRPFARQDGAELGTDSSARSRCTPTFRSLGLRG
jgi:hypothetical protein